MLCQTCADFLAAYRHAVSLYTTRVSGIKPLDGDDVKVYQKTKSLREARRDRHNAWMSWDALIAHLRQDHDGVAAKTALADDSWLMSERTEQLRRACRDAGDALIAHAGPRQLGRKQARHTRYTAH